MAAHLPASPIATPPTSTKQLGPSAAEVLQAIIDSSPFATMAFDREQRIVMWSAGAERLFGWTASELLGGPMPDGMVPGRDRASVEARVRRMLDGATIQGELVRRRTKDGRDIAIEIHAGPVRNARGVAIGYAGHMVDVTRLREMEHDLALGMRYFSRASGCRLVAEGIETDAEARTLAELGVEFGQGHFFGMPEAPTR